MKFTATKKTIVILIVSFLVLVLGVISFIYRDFISNGINTGRWFTLDKYEELLEDCEWEKKGKQIMVNCKALVYPAEPFFKDLDSFCINFYTVSLKDIDKRPEVFNICQERSKLSWEGIEKWFEEEKKYTPVNYSVVYSYAKGGKYLYDHIEVSNVSDKEYEEFKKNNWLGKYYMFDVKRDYLTLEHYYNYVVVDRNAFGFEELGQILFLDATLLHVEAKGEKIFLTFKARMEEEMYEFKTKTKALLLLSEENHEYFENITTDNLDKLELEHEYEISLAYIVNKTDELISKSDSICNAAKELPRVNNILCLNDDYISSDSYNSIKGKDIVKEIGDKKGVVLPNTFVYQLVK